MTNRSPIVLACASVLVPACTGSHTTVGTPDGGTDVPAGTCLERCTGPYTTGVIACIEDRRSCLLDCDGFEDHACVDPCDTTFDACSYDRDYEAERCMEGCPCWEEFIACTEDCEDGPGSGCWASCEADYGTCSGDDIGGMGTCVSGCAMHLMECNAACDSSLEDWVAWVNCDADCERDWNGCMDGCF
jgi:hypothetical protein